MKAYLSLLLFLSLLLPACTTDDATLLTLQTDHFQLSLSETGQVLEMTDLQTGENHLSADTLTSLLSIRVAGQILQPERAEMVDGNIQLFYSDAISASIAVEEKNTHLTFELTEIQPRETVELIVWGPYATSIDQTIGETVGVVRNPDFAIGIQSLNLKTLGGYPWNESDRMPAFDIFREEDWANMHPDADGSVLYRVEAAKPFNHGSTLQAYCRNRSQARIIEDFRHEKILAPAYEDGGVVGSKIALFGCPTEQALVTLGKIELAEGLPHPQIDGQWGKTAPGASAAYIISNFTEANVDEAIALTKQAGLRYLYHYGKTFENWGAFDLYEGEFPDGRESLRRCVEKAEAAGIFLGTHVLSNFITTNDPYVTPVPDDRLAVVGSSVLTAAIDESADEIPIASPDFFNQMENNSLKTVRIGDELIRYGRVSESAPWTLLDCQRGAFGTQVAAHPEGAPIAKLLDHAYKVFLTNADLTVEMSETMASLYNETGLRQISFDGLEGNRSTGLGTYGESLMPYTWYNALDEELKDHLIIDASRTTHFFWHIYTRMNWGEPWYGGFRESQTEYRFNNQAYFQRNYMPGMLGWFKMTPQTSVEDAEWLLAKSAGYDAGYAFVANREAVAQNGLSDKILELIGDWEKLRIGGAFTEVQKERMRATDREFSLQRINDQEWQLYSLQTTILVHENKTVQPGQPRYSTLEFENEGPEQALQFILTVQESKVSDLRFELDNYKTIELSVDLEPGQILKYTGRDKAILYDSNWQQLREIPLVAEDFVISPGKHTLTFECNFGSSTETAGV
jgi:hypothetical protein